MDTDSVKLFQPMILWWFGALVFWNARVFATGIPNPKNQWPKATKPATHTQARIL
jgi:hypothetical protein